MRNQEVIRHFSIPAEIYDLDLPQKILELLTADMPSVTEEFTYGLDLIFSKEVYKKLEFYQFPVTKEQKGPKPRTEDEKRKQIIYDVLAEQLQNVAGAMEELGLRFGLTGIIGEDMESGVVEVILYREPPIELPKGKRKANFRTNTIMPDRPFILEQMARTLVDLYLKQEKEGKIKELEKQLHVANWVSARKLFSTIAEALHSETAVIADVKNKLISEALIESEWPLSVRSRTKNDTAEIVTVETNLDCPEYLIFRLADGGSWDMKKIENLQVAQQMIIKHGFKSKRFKSIVVIHNEKVVPYTLFAEADDGIIQVTPEEAHGYKKLFVNWNKQKQ